MCFRADKLAPSGPAMLEGCDLETCTVVRLYFPAFCEAVPMIDFAQQLQVRRGNSPIGQFRGYMSSLLIRGGFPIGAREGI